MPNSPKLNEIIDNSALEIVRQMKYRGKMFSHDACKVMAENSLIRLIVDEAVLGMSKERINGEN